MVGGGREGRGTRDEGHVAPTAAPAAFVPLRSFVPLCSFVTPPLASCSFIPTRACSSPLRAPLVPACARLCRPWCSFIPPCTRSLLPPPPLSVLLTPSLPLLLHLLPHLHLPPPLLLYLPLLPLLLLSPPVLVAAAACTPALPFDGPWFVSVCL
jgi:hypothetical protein